MQGVWVQPLFGELRSHMLHGQKKKKKQKKNKKKQKQKQKTEAILLKIQERF